MQEAGWKFLTLVRIEMELARFPPILCTAVTAHRMTRYGREMGSGSWNQCELASTSCPTATSDQCVRHGKALDMGRRCRMLRPPIGPLPWAGIEISPVRYTKMDGAVRSEERGAQEVMTALS